jgi:4-hydroxybenzoyl-CoA thioesterase/acyl-CoA thioester hydrolase
VSPPFTTSRQVQFRDTDAAGIAHFTAIFAYLEEAEHALLRHVGLSVHLRHEGQTISWPRVSAQCDFQGAVRFEDVVDIAVRIERLGGASVTYRFDVSHQGRAVATGRMTSVCCRIRDGQPPEAIPIPDWVREKLSPHVADPR